MGIFFSVSRRKLHARILTEVVMMTNYRINMKFLFYMTIVTLSNAGRIPRSFDAHTHDAFPNLHTVHHGHGATSYQNIEMKNHGEISIPTKFYTPHHYVHPEHDLHEHELHYDVSAVTEVPYSIDHGIQNHFFLSNDAETHNSNDIDHIEISNIGEPSSHYEHYDQEYYDYGYH